MAGNVWARPSAYVWDRRSNDRSPGNANIPSFNIVDYGAVPGDPSKCANAAIDAAVAAWLQSNALQGRGKLGGVYIPGGGGDFYICRPIVTPSGTTMFGDGKYLSNLRVGTGDSTTPNLAQGFAGPTLYPRGPPVSPQGAINFVSSLLTGPGQALQFVDPNDSTAKASTIALGDSWCWSKLITQSVTNPNPTKCSLRIGAFKFNGGTGRGNPIVGTKGRDVTGASTQDIGIGFWVLPSNVGAGYQAAAILTTSGQGQQIIRSTAALVVGSTYNLELDWDGANFYFYVNGVHQGHLAATGTMYKVGWEAASIGQAGPEYFYSTNPVTVGSIVDSIEFAVDTYHTGTGSFTPPTAKYTWGPNSVWLWNGDLQAQCPANQVFLMAQTRLNGMSPGWVLHYARPETLPGALDAARYSYFHDFAVYCGHNAGGLTARNLDHFNAERLYIDSPAQYGYAVWDVGSFYQYIEQSDVTNCVGEGIVSNWGVNENKTQGCNVAMTLLGGWSFKNDDQPAGDSFAPIIYGGSQAAQSALWATGNTVDAEGTYPFQRYTVLMDLGGLGGAVFQGNGYQSKNSTNNHATVTYASLSYAGAVHMGDSFYTDPFVPSVKAMARTTEFGGVVSLINCSFPYYNGANPSDTIDGTGWVQFSGQTTFGVGQGNFQTGVAGLSNTGTPTFNLNGITFVLSGHTTGKVVFNTPQLNAKYKLDLIPTVSFGGAPAAGSNRIKSVSKSATGFTFTVEADPAGGTIQYFDWGISGSYDFPDSYTYLPANPSTITNPEAGNTNFAAGVTLIPTAGNGTFTYYNHADQTILQAGTTPLNDHWWELRMSNGAFPIARVGSLAGSGTNAFFIAADGGLRSMFHPGPHNIAISGSSLGTSRYYIDGGASLMGQGNGAAGYTATNATPVYTGERFDTSQPMVDATFRNRKIDSLPFQVITYEPDIGPKAGQDVNVFIGDDFTLGNGALSSSGSYASQLAGTKYGGSHYYYMMADVGQLGALTTNPNPNNPSETVSGIFDRGFVPWAAKQAFSTAVVQLGFQDILYYNQTAANIWAVMQPMLEGAFASGTWGPADRFDNAFGFFVPPTSGSAQVTIQGVNLTCTFNTSIHQTCLDLAAQINANGSLNTIVFAEAFSMPPATQAPNEIWNNRYFSPGQGGTGGFEGVVIVTLPPHAGLAGNGYVTTTTDGANGASWTGWSVTQGSIADSQIGIAGVTLDASFHTNATTTVNDIITRMAANPTVNGLVTGTLVSGNLKVTANAIGNSGNSIQVYGNNAYSGQGGWLNLGSGFFLNLKGGFNGILQTGATKIVVCTVPPFGDDPGYTAGKETERNSLNTLIKNWVTAHAGAGAVLADFDVTLRDPANHNKILPAYLASTQYINNAGHTALVGLVSPLLP